MSARTIPWETIADWYKENEQVIRDVMKFEGLRGAVNEVLRIAPEQPELAALREELAELEDQFDTLEHSNITLNLKLSAAEQRNAAIEGVLRDIVSGNASSLTVIRSLAVAALAKPTESGASE